MITFQKLILRSFNVFTIDEILKIVLYFYHSSNNHLLTVDGSLNALYELPPTYLISLSLYHSSFRFLCFICLRGWHTFSIKIQVVHTLGFAGHQSLLQPLKVVSTLQCGNSHRQYTDKCGCIQKALFMGTKIEFHIEKC